MTQRQPAELMEQLVRHTLRGADAPLGDALVDRAQRAAIDTLGAALGGVPEEAAVCARRAFAACGETACGVLGTRQRADALTAALLNGIAMHALDFDDTCTAWRGHPSAPVLAAALSAAQAVGADGETLLRAYIAGLDAGTIVSRSINSEHYDRGWHSTSTAGVFGAAAAAGLLYGLDAAQLQNAFGLAASCACGLRDNFGSMAKPFHVGVAAKNGLLCALLAREGFTAQKTILESEHGFRTVYAGRSDPIAPEPPFGETLLTTGVLMKAHPSCTHTLRCVEAALILRREGGFDPARIERIECCVLPRVIRYLHYHDPKDGTEAKFSLEFCVSVALLDGALELPHFCRETLARPDVQALMKKVTLTTSPALEAMTDFTREYSILTLTETDGTCRTKRVEALRGSPANPMSDAEVDAKFRSLADPVLTPARAAQALLLLRDLRALPRLDALIDAFTPQERS